MKLVVAVVLPVQLYPLQRQKFSTLQSEVAAVEVYMVAPLVVVGDILEYSEHR